MGEHQFLRIGKYRVRMSRFSVRLLFLLNLTIFTYPSEAETAYGYLRNFCAIPERVPGTAGHRQARDFIFQNLNGARIDSFPEKGVTYYNVYKTFSADTDLTIGLAAHWDSYLGCPGANDGGSGVALLLKLADTLGKNPPPIGVDLLFFDGEDVNQAECIGSNHFAAHCVTKYSFVLVLDMVGDKTLELPKEGNSTQFFPTLVDSLWEIGQEAAPGVFIPAVRYYITDDHISLIKYGIRAVDIIDFDYRPYWHTKDDTIDKCSAESLEKMLRFLLRIVYPKEIY
jgi:hypothetical protein